MINFKLLHDILTIMIISWGYIFQSIYNKISRIYTIATWCSTHFFYISDSRRPARDTINSKCHRMRKKKALIAPLSMSICILDIIYDFCYVLPLIIVLVSICFMLQFSMFLYQAVLCLNISTVYYLFKQSWQDEYFFFLSSATYHKPLFCPWKRLLKCENLVRTEHFLPFSFNGTFQYVPRGSCKIRLQRDVSMFRVICFAWNWTCSMHCNNTICFSMQIVYNDEIHTLHLMIPKV